MTSPVEVVLERLEGVAKSGKSYKARCPAHGDKTPSLSLKEGDDGRVLMHCFAGCSTHEIVAGMGLRMADLFAGNTGKHQVPRIQGVSVRELKAATDHELQILFIVNADRNAGRPISDGDLERTKIALHRIALARRFL